MALPRCPRCDASGLPAESRFCLHCGAPLEVAAGSPPGAPDEYTPDHLSAVLARASSREGERKEVSVLVADVAGSLAVAHRLDPEDLHALMDGFFALALDAVHAEHGTLNQFRGDGFMALFGAPVARRDHAREAVRAALAVRRATEAYSRSVRSRFSVPLVLRMGVHSGPVWVGSIGGRLRRDYTAEGPTVGLAARLEAAAGPGQILASAETARRVAPFTELRPAGVLSVRGVPGPVEAFEVIAAGAHETALDAERARGFQPFVGRAAEIGHLIGGLEAVPAGGAAWIEIVGEPGIGKSRLALEVRARAAGTWLEGRCRESSAAQPYAAWLDLLRRWPGSEAERAATLALARRLAGDEGPTTPDACAAAVRELLGGRADEQGLAILFEDVQWMDVSSRRLVRALLEQPPARGVRFLATLRADLEAGAELPPASERIVLGPIDSEQAASLAWAALAHSRDPEPLAVFAAERGAGNPLYVLEVARAVAEGDEELRHAVRLEASWRRAAIRLPASLQGVIASRLDALPEASKRLVLAASVFGRAFPPALLARLVEEDEAVLRAAGEDLVARSLWTYVGEELDFQHGLHREVAYEQMLRSRRRELHRRLAALLGEETPEPGPELASVIGHHYDRAGEPCQAATLMARAGEGYLGQLAAREAATQLRRAWELASLPDVAASEPRLRLRAGLALARALNALDRSGEAAAVLEAIEPDALEGEERLRLAEACVEGGWVRFTEAGEVERPLALLERGLALARGGRGAALLEARAHAYRIRICHLDGAIGPATESARRVAELATASGERFGVVFGRGNEGYVRCDAGELDAALALCEEACALAGEVRHEVSLALATSWLAKVHAFRGDTEAALRAAERARELGRRTGQEGVLYNAEIWTGLAHLLRGEPKRAAQSFERVAEINDRWPTTLDWLAVGRLETGRLGEAAELARRCLEHEPPRLVRLRALRTLGLALGLARSPELEAAEEAVGESLALGLELGLRPHVAETHAALAELCGRRGDARRAGYYAERAIRGFEDCAMGLHAERVRASAAAGSGYHA